ncbi:MAG: sulfotransferase family protein [Synechococcus sp.]
MALSVLSKLLSGPAAPVFICGTPRSGSTLIHRLLIESSKDLYGITHYEWRYPSICLQFILALTGIKSLRTSRSYWSGTAVSETASKMHPNCLGDYEEDAILFEERCGHHPYEYLHFPYDSLNSKFSLEPQRGGWNSYPIRRRIMRFFKMYCRSLSLLKHPARRFVSKEVASNERLGLLSEHFPGAYFIVITRHPGDYMSSLLPLLQVSTQAKTDSKAHLDDPAWWPSWYFWLSEQARNVSFFYQEMRPAGNVIHVRFEDLVDNPRACIDRVLDFIGATPRSDYESFMSRFESGQASRARGYCYDPIKLDHNDFSEFIETFY